MIEALLKGICLCTPNTIRVSQSVVIDVCRPVFVDGGGACHGYLHFEYAIGLLALSSTLNALGSA